MKDYATYSLGRIARQALAVLLGAPLLALAAVPNGASRIAGYWESPPPTRSELLSATLEPPHPDLDASLLPWALTLYNKGQEIQASAVVFPTPDNNCLPYAIPGAVGSYNFPLEFLITPKLLVILFQLDSQMRIIRMNGTHPQSVLPSWFGDSVGHWEGDTLVIDSVGFNDRAEYGMGIPHTDKLHITERYQPSADGKSLVGTYIYEDAGALSMPYQQVIHFTRSEHFQEFVNGEHNLEFSCPTAEGGSAYQKRSNENLDAILARIKKLPDQAGGASSSNTGDSKEKP